jgi:hypothetical protein
MAAVQVSYLKGWPGPRQGCRPRRLVGTWPRRLRSENEAEELTAAPTTPTPLPLARQKELRKTIPGYAGRKGPISR